MGVALLTGSAVPSACFGALGDLGFRRQCTHEFVCKHAACSWRGQRRSLHCVKSKSMGHWKWSMQPLYPRALQTGSQTEKGFCKMTIKVIF